MNRKPGHIHAGLGRRARTDTVCRSTRRALLLAAATWPILGWASVVRAQPKGSAARSVRVGILRTDSAKESISAMVFIDAMRDLGWVEGRNIIYDRVYAGGDEKRLPALAAELVARRPDLIYVNTNPEASAVAAKTLTVPIVFSAANSPDRGLVKSLARPGGNVTGIANIGWELGGKRM